MKKLGISQFPGSNCDQDTFKWVETKSYKAQFLWHTESFDPKEFEAFIVPGGFSYGDYLRTGALAAQSLVMQSLKQAAQQGRPILGICNGFQILCEAGLLPGVLMQNTKGSFIDKWVELEHVNTSSFFFKEGTSKQRIQLPIAHGDGRYVISEQDLARLEDQNQVWLRYTENPNGSLNSIAGVMSENKKVCGLMPHPERAIFDWMGGRDGWNFLPN